MCASECVCVRKYATKAPAAETTSNGYRACTISNSINWLPGIATAAADAVLQLVLRGLHIWEERLSLSLSLEHCVHLCSLTHTVQNNDNDYPCHVHHTHAQKEQYNDVGGIADFEQTLTRPGHHSRTR